jgi:translation initiation factor IF-2
VAIRIYSLAKDLGLDSKELVDLCARIGIQGKGSALASLEEDEIARIKKHLEEKAAPAAAPAKEAPKPTRDVTKDAPIRDLGAKVAAPKRDISAIRSRMTGGAPTADPAANESIAAVAQVAQMVVAESVPDAVDSDPSEGIAATAVVEPAAPSAETVDEVEKISDDVAPPASPPDAKAFTLPQTYLERCG